MEILAVGDKGTIDVSVPPSLRVLDDLVDVPDKHVCFRVLTLLDGDKRIVWNSLSIQEITDAKKLFDELIEKGMVPYRVDDKGDATKMVMDEFDPLAEECVFGDREQVVFSPEPLLRGG